MSGENFAYVKDSFEGIPKEKAYLNQDDYEKRFGYHRLEPVPLKIVLKQKCRESCSVNGFVNFIYRFIPILYWLPRYHWKRDILNDLIGGLTVGIMHVPQGMAYANLAGLPPVYGLYSSFFSSTIYMFFGTCRQISVGCLAVASLLTGAALAKYTGAAETNTEINGTASHVSPIVAASALTLLIGLIQLMMGVLRLGFFVAYVTDPLVAGFTTGSAFQVMIPQLNNLIGTDVKENEGIGGLYYVLHDLIETFPKTNFITLILSICALVFLFIGKDFVNPIVKKRSPVPLPLELILVIIGVIVSKIAHLNDDYHVKIVAHIPGGFPHPSLPRVDLFPELLANAIPLAIVCYAFVVSNGKLYAKRHKYKIDATQELFALGIMECLSSFFPVFPNGAALSRSQVCEGAGTKTQLYTVFSSTLLLLVILWIGPLLEPLPMCILSCIVISSLKPLFMQFGQLPYLWKVSKYDFATFLISCISTVILNVAPGLLISLVFVMLTVTLRTQWTKQSFIVDLRNSENGTAYYDDRERFTSAESRRGLRILRIAAPICFSNIDLCHSSITKALEELSEIEVEKVSDKKVLLMDFSGVNFVDAMAVDFLKEAQQNCKSHEVTLLFACVSENILSMFERVALHEQIPRHRFFPSISDALASAGFHNRSASNGLATVPFQKTVTVFN